MRIIKLFILVIFFSCILNPGVQTIPEKSDFKRTSLHHEVIDFLRILEKQSPRIKLATLCFTTEGREVPLVIVSNEGISSPYQKKVLNKPAILIVGNIHAGEVEGKDASLMVLRDIAENKGADLLKDQIILFVPIFNADGNDKLGKNRRDNGPELAGVRHNGQHLDLNRDYIKLESPEVNALVKLFKEWDPVLFVDLHTTNGSYHREPVTYTTLSNPNSHQELINFMWKKLFPEVRKTMKKKYKTDAIPYGNFVDRADPEKGWRNHAYEARFGTNYAGLRNRFTILDENYSHADFKTRLMSAYYFIRSIAEFTSKNILHMDALARKADLETMENYSSGDHVLTYTADKLFEFTIKSFEFEKEKIKPEDRGKYPPWIKDFIIKKTDKLKDYKVSYFAKAKPEKSVMAPSGYFILPHHEKVVENLKKHGIIIEKIREEFPGKLENFVIKKVEYGKRLYQGHILITVKGRYEQIKKIVPKGSYYIPMKQPLARLISELLEPESKDSLLKWGFFNREIVRQWTGRPGKYPVFRYNGKGENFLSVRE